MQCWDQTQGFVHVRQALYQLSILILLLIAALGLCCPFHILSLVLSPSLCLCACVCVCVCVCVQERERQRDRERDLCHIFVSPILNSYLVLCRTIFVTQC
jgi:hypothetical protein